MAVGSTSGDPRAAESATVTVLVATERELEQQLLAQALDGRGLRFIQAHDGLQALELARSHSPQLLIVSVSLPKLDAFSLFKRCHQDAQLKDIPFILYSPRSNDQKSARFALEVGAPHFVSNGLKAEVMQEIVGQVLKLSGQASEEIKPSAQVISIESRQLREQNLRLQADLELAQAAAKDLETQLKAAQRNLHAQQTAPKLAKIDVPIVEATSVIQPLFESSPVASWVVSKSSQVFIAVNEAALHLFGYTRAEFLALNQDALLRKRTDSHAATNVLHFQHADGRILSLVLATRDIEYAGQAAELVAAHDLSYRMRGERILADEAGRYRSLLSATPLPYFVVDSSGKLIDLNERYCQLIGNTREALLGSHFTDWLAQTGPDVSVSTHMPTQHAVLKHHEGRHQPVVLHLDPSASVEAPRMVLVVPADDASLAGGQSPAMADPLSAMLGIFEFAKDADEAILLQYATAKLAATFASPLSVFASANPSAGTFEALAVTQAQPGKRKVLEGDQWLTLPPSLHDALTANEPAHLSFNPPLPLSADGELLLHRGLICPVQRNGEHWFLLVANRESDYTQPELRLAQSCSDFLPVLLALKRQQIEASGRQASSTAITANTIRLVQRMLAYHDPYVVAGGDRVAALAMCIGRELGLSVNQCISLGIAAQLHDAGHLFVPRSLLMSPLNLEPGEQALMRTHVDRGLQLLDGIELPAGVAHAIAQHHERADGSGYPRRLRGDEISIEGRVLAVADVIDAMCSVRPHRPAKSINEALEEVRASSGKYFDANVVAACEKVFASTKGSWPSAPLDERSSRD